MARKNMKITEKGDTFDKFKEGKSNLIENKQNWMKIRNWGT